MQNNYSQDLNPESWRMPAEWVNHSATWITWPRRQSDSYGPEYYDPMLDGYCDLVRNVALAEELHINVWDDDHEQDVRKILQERKVPLSSIYFHHFKSYEPWCRDHGPIFVLKKDQPQSEESTSPGKMILNWEYNAWGEKYPPFDLDNEIPKRVAAFRNLPETSPGMILEGGSIEVDGQGTLLTTESCLLNPNRNPELSRSEIEQQLRKHLGVETILWLKEGVAGDDTDGHIDDLTRFTESGKVVSILPDQSSHPDYEVLRLNYELLKDFKDNQGRKLDVVKLPCPEPVIRDGVTLPASYANFYICNRGVLVPTFRQPQSDDAAIQILKDCFPGREVIGIDCFGIIWGLGSLHCLTQQEPA